MPEALAKQSIILVNYPEDVRLPGDDPTSGRSKGISDLTMSERMHLVEALRDEDVKIHFKLMPEQRQGLFHYIILCYATRC
jgi:hypothetical protein